MCDVDRNVGALGGTGTHSCSKPQTQDRTLLAQRFPAAFV